MLLDLEERGRPFTDEDGDIGSVHGSEGVSDYGDHVYHPANSDADVDVDYEMEDEDDNGDTVVAANQPTETRGANRPKKTRGSVAKPYRTKDAYEALSTEDKKMILDAIRRQTSKTTRQTRRATREELDKIWPYKSIDKFPHRVNGDKMPVCDSCVAALSTQVDFRQTMEVMAHAVLSMWNPDVRPWHYKDTIPSDVEEKFREVGCMLVSQRPCCDRVILQCLVCGL